LATVFFFEVSDQIIPEQTTEGLLSSRHRHVSSFVVWPLALCTMALDAQVGQEGVGKADQMQVCNCRPIRPILVLAEPQQLLTVLEELLDGMISNDKFCCTRWGTLPLSWWRRPLRLRR
jgi:hypothetical protein